MKNLLLSIAFLLSCSNSRVLNEISGVYSYSDNEIKFRLELYSQSFRIWINERATSCYSEGSYLINDNRIILNSIISSEDVAFQEIYGAGECQLDSSVIIVQDSVTVLFDKYYLTRQE